MFENFSVEDFPPTNPLVSFSGGYVYVLCWVRNGVQSPFYVGQTMRLAGRMNDYCIASFAACTDFRVGEAVRYLRDAQQCRIVVTYKPSMEPREAEYEVIRELQLSGVRLLNDFSSYDYRTAKQADERVAVQRFCDTLLSANQSLMKLPTVVIGSRDTIVQNANLVSNTGSASSPRKRKTVNTKKLSNHDRFAEAFREYPNREISTDEITTILLQRFPEMSRGSILPNDHAEGNKGACWCAATDQRIFDRVRPRTYRVRQTATAS